MDKPVIRSITVFTDKPGEWSSRGVRELVDRAEEIIRDVSKRLEDKGYSIWTTRITLPIPPLESYKRIDKIIGELDKPDHLVSIGGLYLEKIDTGFVREIVSRGIYTGLLWREVFPLDKVTDIFYELGGIDPVYTTRIAVSLLGEPMETPYYPLSSSLHGWGIGIALLYPKQLMEIYSVGGLEGIRRFIDETHRGIEEVLLGSYRLVIDHSISPWMDESVASLIEAITGERVGNPGFIEGIHILNEILKDMVDKHENIGGFNEVMLPYAEDSRLIDAGGGGLIRARDLLFYSSICVAGPDMIVVPRDRGSLRSFIKASHILAIHLGKKMALRIIPVEGRPGDRVRLGKFGEAYIIDY